MLFDHLYFSLFCQFSSEFEQFIEISDLQSITKVGHAFLDATAQIFSDYEKTEFIQPKVMQYNGRRWSVANSYHRHSQQKNHQVSLNAKVEKILLDESAETSLKAVGIMYRKNGQLHEVRANKAVILTSGTIGTPSILLKSGIGPEHLYASYTNKTEKNSLKIKLRKNLPAVGQHLQDHVTTGLDLITLNQSLSLEPWYLYSAQNLYNYFRNGNGPLTMTGCEGLGFIKTKPNLIIPNLGFMIIPISSHIDAGVYFRRLFNINERTWGEYFRPLITTSTISILPIVLHPKSRGFVTIRSTRENHMETIIQPQYLSHPDDIDVLVSGIKIIIELINTNAFKALGATLTKRHLPGCEDKQFASDDYWRCYVQHLTLTAYHYVGTCRMGTNHSDSVVDPHTFQVHGIEQLYICDASIMPSLPSANPQAAVGMLARKFLHSFHYKKRLTDYLSVNLDEF